MKTYIISMSDSDMDFVIQSVRSYTEAFVQELETERWFAKSEEKEELQRKKETFPEVKNKPTAVYAPFGLKKDGTPSKRRGRPTIKKAKKVTA
jgi:hypothetical protein